MASWFTLNPRINLRTPSMVRAAGQVFVVAQPDRFQLQLARAITFGFALSWVLFG